MCNVYSHIKSNNHRKYSIKKAEGKAMNNKWKYWNTLYLFLIRVYTFLYINLYCTVEVPIKYLRVPNMGQLKKIYIGTIN